MNWFYVEAGQQAGPVDDAQLDELARTGKIQPETLVWHEGMENWQALRDARPAAAPSGTTTPPVINPTIPVGGEQVVCAECGRIFDKESTIQFGNVRVCAQCKPTFMQKLAEGAHVEGGLNYAGFWIRFA